MTEALSPLEARLRVALVDLRPADGPSQRLRDLVAGVPDRAPRAGLIARLRPLAAVVAVAAVVAIVASLSIGRGLGIPPGPGAGPPPPVGIDPNVEGPGVVTSAIRTLPLVAVVSVAALGLAALWLARRGRGKWRARSLALVPLLLLVAPIGLLLQPGPGVGGYNAWGPSLGIRVAQNSDEAVNAGQPLSAFYVIAEARQPFVFAFVVHNPGPLPLRLDGIVERPDARDLVVPRWTALAFGTDPNAIGQPVEELVPFTPVEIAADGYLPLYVVGKASACAVGPSFGGADQAFSVRGPAIELAYSVLGLSSVATYQMPMQIEEPIRNGCPG